MIFLDWPEFSNNGKRGTRQVEMDENGGLVRYVETIEMEDRSVKAARVKWVGRGACQKDTTFGSFYTKMQPSFVFMGDECSLLACYPRSNSAVCRLASCR